MNERIAAALAKWPDVPALYGWLKLDRRGRWWIRGELISRPQIIDTLNGQYAADKRGCWYFQNGPQRGYVALAYAPLVLLAGEDGHLQTHTGKPVTSARHACLDEDGGLLLDTVHGPAGLADDDLDWALSRLRTDGHPADEDALMVALAKPSGAETALRLRLDDGDVPVTRLDRADMPARFGFVRDPQPET